MQQHLAVALAGGSGAVKVKHSTAFDPLSVKMRLGVSVSTWDSFMYRMKGLSERRVKAREATNYFIRVFSDMEPTGSKPSDRNMKKVMALFDGQGNGAELASSKGTAFGLLNSITEFVDHERRAMSPDHRLESAWFGYGAALKEKALQYALMLID